MPTSEWQEWFEAAWADREERLYPSLFGTMPNNIYPLGPDAFEGMPMSAGMDPRWFTIGVIECGPNEKRANWLYVSSGLSNAWEADAPDPDSLSGLGCEFVLQTGDQAPWALLLLRRMVAFDLCLAHGRFPGKSALQLWARIPLRAPIDGRSSSLTFLLLAPMTGHEGTQQILSGHFQLLNFIGITEDEAALAREHGGDRLYRNLLERGAAPITRPERKSILE
jgi:hypothetical protein